MTEDIVFTDEQDQRIADLLSICDGELQELLDISFGDDDQSENTSFGIMLSLPSGVMGGAVITRAAWTRRVNQVIREAGVEQVAEAREANYEAIEPKRLEARAAYKAEGRLLPPRQYIHLKDAELKSGGETFAFRNARVALSQVSAWELGSWTIPAPKVE